jgi:hypothetical protein
MYALNGFALNRRPFYSCRYCDPHSSTLRYFLERLIQSDNPKTRQYCVITRNVSAAHPNLIALHAI